METEKCVFANQIFDRRFGNMAVALQVLQGLRFRAKKGKILVERILTFVLV